jgi:thymidine kinase
MIECIVGGMFAGKSEELLRRIGRVKWAKQSYMLFKPEIDTRYGTHTVQSHSGLRMPCVAFTQSKWIEQMVEAVEAVEVVGIDEAQFMEDDLPDLCLRLSKQGKRVIVAGLDMDSRGEPFGPIPRIMAMADKVDKVHAICTVCGRDANRSQRLVQGDSGQVLVGGADMYEARCLSHWEPL